MDIEKKLAKTDLNQFKQDPLKLLIKQLYKYQDFKFKKALSQINTMNFKESTVYEYYRNVRRYLRDGVKQRGFKTIYAYIDELKNSGLTPLRPSKEDACINYARRVTPPTTTPVKVEPPKYIEKIPPQYGIKCGDWIRLQPTKEMCLGYIECYKVIGDGKPVELVTVDLEVEEL